MMLSSDKISIGTIDISRSNVSKDEIRYSKLSKLTCGRPGVQKGDRAIYTRDGVDHVCIIEKVWRELPTSGTRRVFEVTIRGLYLECERLAYCIYIGSAWKVCVDEETDKIGRAHV